MRFAHTTRWGAAGAALGLTFAVSAGVAIAGLPGSSGPAVAPPAARASAPVLAAATTTPATTTTTTPAPSPNASSGTQAPAGSSPMMSAMLASLSPQAARAEFQALYSQVLTFMNSTPMMRGTAATGPMMDQPATGNEPTAGQASAS